MEKNENTTIPFTINIIRKSFKTNTGESVQRDCVDFEISGIGLELILDPGVNTELYKKAAETFVEKLQETEGITVNYTKEAVNTNENNLDGK